MVKVWGRNNSINVQKVMWALGELGLAHERIDIGGPFGMNKEPPYLAMNPNGPPMSMRSCASPSSPSAHITFCTLIEFLRPRPSASRHSSGRASSGSMIGMPSRIG